MAREGRLQISFTIRKPSEDQRLLLMDYDNRPKTCSVDIDGTNGPVPGAVRIPTTGRSIDLSELTLPGEVFMHNMDEDNFVEFGILDDESGNFFPLGEILPGHICKFRFSRNLFTEYESGTGTSGRTNFFHMRANGGPAIVKVEAFDS